MLVEVEPVVAVLLAAGGSSRLGQPKQLLNWRGRPLLVHSIAQLREAGCDLVVVVLGAYVDECQRACDLPGQSALARTPVVCGHHRNWADGQASSLHFGLKLAESFIGGPFHALVAVSDQPLLTSVHYRGLIEAVRERRCSVAATRYPEGAGVPACFQHQCRANLMRTSGDQGAKAWVRKQPPTEVIEFDFGQETRDIDTVEQWLNLSGHV